MLGRLTQVGWTRRQFLRAMCGGLAGAAFFTQSGSSQQSLKIGLQVDLTGGLPDYGYWHLKVVRAAIEKVNAEGGIAGRKVELAFEDTATREDTGRERLAKLSNEGANLIIGSQHSGVSLASLDVARELKIVYFPLGEATEITGERANRYVIRPNHSVRSHAQVGHRWAVENLGKRWTILVAQYAFGQSHAKEWPPLIERAGGRVLEIVQVPLNTEDFVPHLLKIAAAPADRFPDVLFHVFPGANAGKFLRQAAQLGLLERLKSFGVICTIDGIHIEDVPAIEGSWYLSNHPRRLDDVPERLRGFDAEFRQRVGVAADGTEVGTGRPTTGSHYWYGWETVHLIKRAIEETGWKDRRNNADVVRYLEGIQIKSSVAAPQGNKFIRAEDHQAFHDHYLELFQGGRLRVKQRFEYQQAVYAPEVDLTKQEF